MFQNMRPRLNGCGQRAEGQKSEDRGRGNIRRPQSVNFVLGEGHDKRVSSTFFMPRADAYFAAYSVTERLRGDMSGVMRGGVKLFDASVRLLRMIGAATGGGRSRKDCR